jgi:RecA/RadA recombinase
MADRSQRPEKADRPEAADRKERGVESDKALDMAVSQIHRQFGKGAIMKMGDAADRKIEVISTGALALDLALGVGGVPRGRVVEMYGTAGSLPSSMRSMLSILATPRPSESTSTNC